MVDRNFYQQISDRCQNSSYVVLISHPYTVFCPPYVCHQGRLPVSKVLVSHSDRVSGSTYVCDLKGSIVI